MVIGIVGPAGILLDDDPFRVPRAAAHFWIYIVLAVVTARQPSFPILKRSATDISRESLAPMLLNCLQQVFGFLRGILRDAMQLSIEGRCGIVKSRRCGLIGWDGGRRYDRFIGRTGAESTGRAEQQSTKDDEYSIDLPSSIHSFAFELRSERAQYEP